MPELKSIKGVEIFSAGVWNGDKYTKEDLQEMVRAFEENKDAVRPFLKLGHDSEQKLLQSEGLPAAGWVDRIYISGDKLLADFMDIPKKVFELIQNRAYRKVSAEIFWNLKIGERLYKRMLGAIALLGAETPGVMNLSDILANYKLDLSSVVKVYADEENKDKLKQYEFENVIPEKDGPMSTEENKEVEALKAEKEALEAQVKKFTAEKDAQKEKLDELQKKAEEAEKRSLSLESEKAEVQMEKDLDKLESEKVICPSLRGYAQMLLDSEPESKVYTIENEDKSKKELSKLELVKEFAKGVHEMAKVNFEENSEDSKDEGNKSIEDEIEKYMSDNDVKDYATAYRAVSAGKLKPQKQIVEDEE